MFLKNHQSLQQYNGEKLDPTLLPPYTSESQHLAQSSSKYPPQPYHAQSPSRTLQVEYPSWKSSGVSVIDSGTGTTVLSTTGMRIRKPHMTFTSPEGELGTATFHTFSPKIDFQVRGQSFTVNYKWAAKRELRHASPSFNGQWKSRSYFHAFDFECLDENSMPLARFSSKSWALKKVGAIELFGKASSGPVMDEILVTGLAIAEYARTYNATVASSGAAAAAGAAAA